MNENKVTFKRRGVHQLERRRESVEKKNKKE